jgi:hypothetical protein
MSRWANKTEGWLKRYRPKKEHDTVKPIGRPIKRDADYGVIFIPLKCPKCRSKNIKCHTSNPPIRYHVCKDCGHKFKSIEANSQ